MLPVLLRAAPWRALLSLSAAGAALGGLALLVPTGTGTRLLQMALVLGGGAAACALEEPAAAVVGACPVRRSTQVAARALAAAPPLVAGAGLLLLWSSAREVDRLLLLQLLGCWLLGFSLAVLARARLDEPAEVVASGVVLSLLAVMYVNLVGRHVVLFPLGEQLDRATRTWAVVIAAAVVAVAVAVRERWWRAR